jgi:hypothetical protein
MRRVRRFAVALLALGIVTSAMYATGAFTNLTAQRNANIQVAGDASGYLSLQPASGPNGKYATLSRGKLHIAVTGVGKGPGQGVNRDAMTIINNVFTVTNHGSQAVALWLTDKAKAVTFEREGSGTSIEGKKHAVTLPPGESIAVGLVIDTRHVGQDVRLSQSMTIHANAAGVGKPTGGSAAEDVRQPSVESPSKEEKQSSSADEQSSNKRSSKSNNGGGLANAITGTLDYLVGGTDEWVARQVDKLVAGFEKVWDMTTEQLTRLMDVIREKADDLSKFIDDKYQFIYEHKSELREHSESTPGFYDDVIVWTLLHPERVWELSLGALLGAVGMPKGLLPVEESSSVSYFVGWMTGGFVPVVDVIADARDTVQAILNRNLGAATLGIASLLPGYGKVGDIAQIPKYLSDWMGGFGSKADDLYRALKSGILSRFPSNMKQTILDALPDRVSKSLKKGGERVKDGAKREGKRIKDGAKRGGKRIKDGAKKKVRDGARKVDDRLPDRVSEPMKKGGGRVKKKLGEGRDRVKKRLGKERDKVKKKLGRSDEGWAENKKIVAGSGTIPDEVVQNMEKTDDAKQVKRLLDEGVPVEHMNDYLKMDVPLNTVSKIMKSKSPKKTYKIIKNARRVQTYVGYGGKYLSSQSWCKLQPEYRKEKPFCESVLGGD